MLRKMRALVDYDMSRDKAHLLPRSKPLAPLEKTHGAVHATRMMPATLAFLGSSLTPK